MKTVSVVMATYNGGKYLKEQLDSIINQTYPIYEIIIQDDCSTDGTKAILEDYACKHENIKLFFNKQNLGFNENFKSAVKHATGDYVAIADQDDVWFNNKIERQVEQIGNCNICSSFLRRGMSLETSIQDCNRAGFEHILFNNLLGHTFLCKTSFVQDDKNWMPHVWYDWGLAINAFLNGNLTIVEEPLCWHRIHPDEVTWRKATPQHYTYQPYLFGLKRYRELQKEENWSYVFSYIYKHTSKDFYPVVHKMTGLLIKDDLFSLFYLCCLCCKHRKKIYPSKNVSGLMGIVRGFFYPMIYAYNPNIITFKRID